MKLKNILPMAFGLIIAPFLYQYFLGVHDYELAIEKSWYSFVSITMIYLDHHYREK